MHIVKQSFCQAKLEYPRRWTYKVIGPDKTAVRAAIESVCRHKEYELQYSNRSRSGKYHSWSVVLEVADEMERNLLFAGLKGHEHVTMVL